MQLKSQMSELKKTLKSLRRQEQKSGGQVAQMQSTSTSASDDCLEEQNAVDAITAEIDTAMTELQGLLETLRIRTERLDECLGMQAMSFEDVSLAVDLMGDLVVYCQEILQ